MTTVVITLQILTSFGICLAYAPQTLAYALKHGLFWFLCPSNIESNFHSWSLVLMFQLHTYKILWAPIVCSFHSNKSVQTILVWPSAEVWLAVQSLPALIQPAQMAFLYDEYMDTAHEGCSTCSICITKSACFQRKADRAHSLKYIEGGTTIPAQTIVA